MAVQFAREVVGLAGVGHADTRRGSSDATRAPIVTSEGWELGALKPQVATAVCGIGWSGCQMTNRVPGSGREAIRMSRPEAREAEIGSTAATPIVNRGSSRSECPRRRERRVCGQRTRALVASIGVLIEVEPMTAWP